MVNSLAWLELTVAESVLPVSLWLSVGTVGPVRVTVSDREGSALLSLESTVRGTVVDGFVVVSVDWMMDADLVSSERDAMDSEVAVTVEVDVPAEALSVSVDEATLMDDIAESSP